MLNQAEWMVPSSVHSTLKPPMRVFLLVFPQQFNCPAMKTNRASLIQGQYLPETWPDYLLSWIQLRMVTTSFGLEIQRSLSTSGGMKHHIIVKKSSSRSNTTRAGLHQIGHPIAGNVLPRLLNEQLECHSYYAKSATRYCHTRTQRILARAL